MAIPTLYKLNFVLIFAIALASCSFVDRLNNGYDSELKLQILDGWSNNILEWRSTDAAKCDFSLALSAIWFKEDARHGWFAGNYHLLKYEDGKWQCGHSTSSLLHAIWLDEEGTHGWAVGQNGAIVRYNDGNWKTDEMASNATEKTLRALWLDEEGTHGWAVGENGVILRYANGNWVADEMASNATGKTLRALWLNKEGTHGWAVGGQEGLPSWAVGRQRRLPSLAFPFRLEEQALEPKAGGIVSQDYQHLRLKVRDRGVILRYGPEGWQKHKDIDDLLRAVWLNEQGTRGWAAGDSGTMLKYGNQNWERDPAASDLLASGSIRALWLNQEGLYGWAVGAQYRTVSSVLLMLIGGQLEKLFGEILIYNDIDGWQRYLDPEDEIRSASEFRALWFNSTGSHGWALSGTGDVFEIVTADTVQNARIVPHSPGADLSLLKGEFRVIFPKKIYELPTLKIVTFDSDSDQVLSPDQYKFERIGESRREFKLQFSNISPLVPNPYKLLIFAKVGEPGATSTIALEESFVAISPTKSPVTNYLIPAVIGLLWLLTNVSLVILAIWFSWARTLILHRIWAPIIGLGLGKILIVDLLILFVRPLRQALFREFRIRVSNDPTYGWNPRADYIPPKVEIAGLHTDAKVSEADDNAVQPPHLWSQVLDNVLTVRGEGIWLVKGPSGLGKTALLKNWVNASVERDWTPFLISLGSSPTLAEEATSLINQHGDFPWSSERKSEVERADDLLSRGRFLFLLDGYNEDRTRDKTKEFVRRMMRRNIIVLTSQFQPEWDDINMRPIALHPFGPQQLSKILPETWVDRALKMKNLESIIALPQSAQLLAKYIQQNHELPNSPIRVYENLCSSLIPEPKFLNLEEEAWRRFCCNQDQFQSSHAVPEIEICRPATQNGLLTRREEKGNTVYKFAHERIQAYLVARYLFRQGQQSLFKWDNCVKAGLPPARWDDVIDLWAGIIIEDVECSKTDQRNYMTFLMDAARFRIELFAERLYPQYEKLRDDGHVVEDHNFERWAASQLPVLAGSR